MLFDSSIFLMFTISGENTVPCLEAFGDKTVSVHRKNISFTYEHNEIFVFFLGNLPQSSDINGSHRKSSVIIDNCRKMAKNSLLYTKENNIGPFGAVFWLFLAWKKLLLQCILYCSCCNLTVSCYRAKKVSRYPHSYPLEVDFDQQKLFERHPADQLRILKI